MDKLCDVFISYRKKDGTYPAILLHRELTEKGYHVFLDSESMRRGDFPPMLIDAVSACVDFILVVTAEMFSERIFDEGDWVRNEIRTALKLKKNIVPIFIGDAKFPSKLPPDIESVADKNGITQIDANLIRESNEKLAMEFMVSKPKSKDMLTIASRRCSIYNPIYGNELDRLKIQAQNSFQSDSYILKELPSKKTVLDVGCAYGFVGLSRFADKRFCKVLGIDKSDKCIELAKKNANNDKFVYDVVDIESEYFEESLSESMAKNRIDEFNVIFIALVLHHIKEPIKLLRRLRKFLSSNGVIIIRGSDDGSKICYNDDGLMDRIIHATMSTKGVSDRINGRKIFKWLSDSGYTDINIHSFMRDTSRLDFDDKMRLFKESFSYRINYPKMLWEQNPDDVEKRQAFENMEIMLAAFEERFYSNDFWYAEYDYIGCAKKQ